MDVLIQTVGGTIPGMTSLAQSLGVAEVFTPPVRPPLMAIFDIHPWRDPPRGFVSP